MLERVRVVAGLEPPFQIQFGGLHDDWPVVILRCPSLHDIPVPRTTLGIGDDPQQLVALRIDVLLEAILFGHNDARAAELVEDDPDRARRLVRTLPPNSAENGV